MPAADPTAFEMTRWIVLTAVPAIAGLAGVLMGSWLTRRQQKEQRKLDFVEKQLRCFYSPLVGIRNEIYMLSDLRLTISQSSDRHWRKLCEEAREAGGPDYVKKVTDGRRDEFMKSIEYDNNQLTEGLLPAYRRMVTIFRDNYYLAEERTCVHFRPLLEFVDIWDRWLDRSIPREVIEELGHNEKSLQALYTELEETHATLRAKLSNGKA